jgi:hypothetical protein
MGLVYTIQMQDDFNWEYVGTNKQDRIRKFISDFKKIKGYGPTLLAEWEGEMVFDIEKNSPDIDRELNDLIFKNCDSAIFWNDTAPYKKHKLKPYS